MVFDGYGFGLFALVSTVVSLVFFVLVIVLLVLGIRWLLRQERASGEPRERSRTHGEDAALALLRERFARGEIDADEYEERRRLLG